MKNECCWVEGKFNYTPLIMEVLKIRSEVEKASDAELVDDVSYVDDFMTHEVGNILYRYMVDGNLHPNDRETLIWFYVLVNIKDYLVVDESGEW